MPSLVLFEAFPEAVAEKKHNLGADTLTVALTDVAPVASSGAVLADITQISYTNLGSRTLTISSSSHSGAVYSLVLADKTLTASGTVAQWRYAVIYNDTATNDELIGYIDLGSEVNMVNGSNVILDFSGSGAITITIS